MNRYQELANEWDRLDKEIKESKYHNSAKVEEQKNIRNEMKSLLEKRA